MNKAAPRSSHSRTTDTPVSAVIDIGSNSIRFVAFRGHRRTPLVLFNEKVMAGLGRGVSENGAISAEGMDAARAALARFKLLCDDMRVERLHVFATAAVREASNRAAFLDMAKTCCDIDVSVLSGAEEARYAAYGVIAGIPDARGIVGDLGGGSLEMIEVKAGRPGRHLSLPIGALRLDDVRKKGPRGVQRLIKKALTELGWAEAGRGLPFYTVGGSWRALVQLHMHLSHYPLPVVHQYTMTPAAAEHMARALPNLGAKRLKAVPRLSSNRVPQLPGAALLLRALVKKTGSSCIVASAYGVREGVLYAHLPEALRREDPLISAAREEARIQGRFPEHGDALMAWMDGLYREENPADSRLRLVAAILADTAWRAHPDFRAERGLDIALYGNWVGISGRERAILAAALFATYGGARDDPSTWVLQRLAERESLARAVGWGLALRIGQRLTAGTAEPLSGSRLFRERDRLILTLRRDHRALYADAVARRLDALANALDLKAEFRVEA